MKHGTVNSDMIGRFNRMDAAFLLLAQEHWPVAEELLAHFSKDELIELARKLPADKEVERIVMPGSRPKNVKPGEASLQSYPTNMIAVYVAAVGKGAIAKFDAEAEVFRQQEAEVIDRMAKVFKLADREGVDQFWKSL